MVLEAVSVFLLLASACVLFAKAYFNLRERQFSGFNDLTEELGNEAPPWDEEETLLDPNRDRSLYSCMLAEYEQHAILSQEGHLALGCANPFCLNPPPNYDHEFCNDTTCLICFPITSERNSF
jgi:hypothetical protein